MLNNEEFKSLQLQVREISLLRESNMQIREENKHTFEECQKLREEIHKAKLETENISKHLCEKQIEYDACMKEIEMLRMETENLNKRNAQLLETCKNIDVEYERMKNEFLQNKVLLNDKEAEIKERKPKLSEMQCHILKVEQELAKCQSDLGEQMKRINDAPQREVNLKSEHKQQLTSYKKRNETFAKKIQELTNENRALAKQIEESKPTAGRKSVNDIQSEQATIEKEKDMRLQTLEKALERVRTKRAMNEAHMISLAQNFRQNKEKVEDKLVKHKHAIAALLETKAVSASQLPSTSLLEERTTAYFLSVAKFEELANSFQNDSGGTQSTPAEVPTTEPPASTLVSGRKVPTQQMRIMTPHVKVTEEKNKGLIVPRPSEVRKGWRKLVRPSLDRQEEVTAEIEMLVIEGTTLTEGKCSTSHKSEHPVDTSLRNVPSSGRKRPALSLPSNVREEAAASDGVKDDAAPQLKKSNLKAQTTCKMYKGSLL